MSRLKKNIPRFLRFYMGSIYKGSGKYALMVSLSCDDNQGILNYYEAISKIQDRFPDSCNDLILLELSLSTLKPPFPRIIQIIKKVVGRLESEPSQNQNWPDNHPARFHLQCRNTISVTSWCPWSLTSSLEGVFRRNQTWTSEVHYPST